MWARSAEVMLGLWLMISPFVFATPPEETLLWVHDLGGGAVVMTIALLACWHRIDKIHYLNIAVAVYLGAIGYLVPAETPPPGPYQNLLVVALLLVVLAVIPTRIALPPRSWQAFYEQKAGQRPT